MQVLSPCWGDGTQQRGPSQSPGRLLKNQKRRGVSGKRRSISGKRLEEKGDGQLGMRVDKVGENESVEICNKLTTKIIFYIRRLFEQVFDFITWLLFHELLHPSLHTLSLILVFPLCTLKRKYSLHW